MGWFKILGCTLTFARAEGREIAVCEDIVKQFPVFTGTLTGLRQLSAVAILVSTCLVLPEASQAQGLTGETVSTAVILPVASVRLTPLPDAAMAVVTGMGLKSVRPVNGNTGSAPSIILWDELRPAAHEPTVVGGLANVTVNGVMQ